MAVVFRAVRVGAKVHSESSFASCALFASSCQPEFAFVGYFDSHSKVSSSSLFSIISLIWSFFFTELFLALLICFAL